MTEENKNPFDLVDKENKIANISKEVSDKWWKFLENLVRKIAKMLWLPDPKAWLKDWNETTKEETKEKKGNATDTQSTTLEQDISSKEGTKMSFDNIMSSVTWVLKDIGEKVSEKTWIDFNNPLKKKDETVNNEEWNSEKLVNNDEAWKETQKDAA